MDTGFDFLQDYSKTKLKKDDLITINFYIQHHFDSYILHRHIIGCYTWYGWGNEIVVDINYDYSCNLAMFTNVPISGGSCFSRGDHNNKTISVLCHNDELFTIVVNM